MAILLDTDKCYLLGLLVWGGIMKSWSIQIVLPFNKWGKLELDPSRWWLIAEDILKRVKPIWRNVYEVDVSYQIWNWNWTIILDSVSDKLRSDLAALGLSDVWEFRQNADITKIEGLFRNDEMVRQFIAWMVDTVGSLAESHRRFTNDFQIISFEFMGKNFSLVLSMLRLFFRMGIIPDQVLWNHPNQHSWFDRYYSAWKKWFKIRVVLDDYTLRGSFVFQSKKLSAEKNRRLQEAGAKTSSWKDYRIDGHTCVHTDENSVWIPESIRGRHFVHFTHLASYLGVEFPGALDEIKNPEKHICPFTILTKGSFDEIQSIILSEPYLQQTTYTRQSMNLAHIYQCFTANRNALVFGKTDKDGFPVNMVLQWAAFVIAASKWITKGKRVLGSYEEIIEHEISNPATNLTLQLPDRGTCLIVANGKFSALVWYSNEEFTKTLISQNGLEIKVREPDFEECISLTNS